MILEFNAVRRQDLDYFCRRRRERKCGEEHMKEKTIDGSAFVCMKLGRNRIKAAPFTNSRQNQASFATYIKQ
jgi:hypothetical protein